MRIAIPSMDGATISAHFGHSRCFLVLGIEGGRITFRERRMNAKHHGADHGTGHPVEHHGHDHGAFARLLSDCDTVLCGGIGLGARTALEAAGLRVQSVDSSLAPEDAALRLASGNLPERTEHNCGCGGRS